MQQTPDLLATADVALSGFVARSPTRQLHPVHQCTTCFMPCAAYNEFAPSSGSHTSLSSQVRQRLTSEGLQLAWSSHAITTAAAGWPRCRSACAMSDALLTIDSPHGASSPSEDTRRTCVLFPGVVAVTHSCTRPRATPSIRGASISDGDPAITAPNDSGRSKSARRPLQMEMAS